MQHRASLEIGGRELSIETGRLAKQADGAALVRYGDTVVLVTACAAREPKDVDFLPLTVDYKEYTYAAGRFPGGFFKREGRPTEKEILTSRCIDRPIRPLFPEGYNCETQVIAFVVSADGENEPDVLSMLGASSALYFSDIPFHKPIAGVRIGLIDGALTVNPRIPDMERTTLNLVVVGSEDAIVMVECSCKEIAEGQMLEALDLAHGEIRRLIGLQKEIHAKLQPVKRVVEPPVYPEDLMSEVRGKYGEAILAAIRTPGKLNSERRVKELKKEIVESYPEEDEARRKLVKRVFDRLKEEIFRKDLLENRRRTDDRAFDQIRPLDMELSFIPRTHGSALFTRGETQSLVTVTLGTSGDSQVMETLDGESSKTFMVHYNFPPFSVGEVAFLRGPGRREIGHGALAEKALRAVIPPTEVFPYTIRVVSDILESNGSSSQATICGGSLALMDAGVPISKAVAGVAMGLVLEGDKHAILTDIAGFEDHYGDMDFKVAGTRDGITALQMDIKIEGITPAIMKEALEQALRGRLFLLDKMDAVIDKPRPELSSTAPRYYTMTISDYKIKDLIGPGGKTIKSIVEATKAKIDIENDGTVKIFASDEKAAEDARRRINDICAEAEVGKVYTGKVTRLEAYGAFVEILPGTDGLMHISEVSHRRTPDIHDVLKLGDEIQVKVIGIEPPNKVKLSMKALQEPPEGMSPEEERHDDRPPRRHHDRPRGDRGDRGDRGHGGHRR
ncbi:MAG: polyribonucleotide nucleotidyltransferase [Acidobacteria bacterium]|nr:polyribonucleotide nucleotidyltransferase [Acidobacteriota bacterium]